MELERGGEELRMTTAAKLKTYGRATGEILCAASDETLLLEYVTSRDSTLFDELVKRYDQPLTDYVRRHIGDAELAQDAVQGTWLQLHLKCHTFKEGGRVRPWLFTIAVNQAIDAIRSGRRFPKYSLEYAGSDGRGGAEGLRDSLPSRAETSDELAERKELCEQVRRVVGRLPQHLRQLVRLVFFEGLKYREAAQMLAIPEGTAKSRMHAAFGQLHDRLAQMAS